MAKHDLRLLQRHERCCPPAMDHAQPISRSCSVPSASGGLELDHRPVALQPLQVRAVLEPLHRLNGDPAPIAQVFLRDMTSCSMA